VPPAYHWTLPLQMQMGKVVAVRDESTAKDKILPGDIISGVRLVYDAEPAIEIDVLDPIRLPFLLVHTIEKANKPDPAKWKVELKVKRPPSDPSVKKDALVEVLFTLDWQDQWSSNDEVPAAPSSPMSIPQLGIAYLVESLVLKVTDPALTEIQKGDVIEKISVREPTEKGSEEKWTNWVKIQSKRDGEKVSDQWAYFALYYLQLQEHPEVKVQLQAGQQDRATPVDGRCILASRESRLALPFRDEVGEGRLVT